MSTYSEFAKAVICLAILSGLAGCQQTLSSSNAPTPTASPPNIELTILPPMTETPLRKCMPYPGVKLEALSISSDEIDVKVAGLNPGERVILVFYAEEAEQTFKIESTPLEGADSSGSFEYIQTHKELPSSLLKKWQVQVIHATGVACTTINIP